MAEMVEEPLENVGGGGFVDELGAAAAREVGRDHAALDRCGRKPLVPKSERQLGMRQEILRELAHALSPRAVAAIERERQTNNDAADPMARDFVEQAFHIIAE